MSTVIAIGAIWNADVLGFSASVISFILFIPQAQQVWMARADTQAMAVVSFDTQLLLLSNAVIWAVYALQTKAFWVGAPGLVNGPLAIFVMVLIVRSRRAVSKNQVADTVSA